LVIGEDAHASHESAACLHRLVTLAPQGQQVCLTRSRLSGGTGGRLTGCHVHAAELPEPHRTGRHEVPVTSVARTVIDLARCRSFREGVITADSALHVRLTTRAELQSVLVDCAGWPGARRAMHVVRFAEPKTESPAGSVGGGVCL